ncbi:sensor histidine kinase [Virgibacillus siamensis]|uniref:sensor histidine kinase n=1 Tax=Virgibacillus siamensis TaxID=480071 RepID=UPI0009869B8B|nr:sensor histidine kinase [Virgibacillus siamensis]
MIGTYLKERRSWILLIITLQAVTLLIAAIDPTIPFRSLLYIVFLSLIIFTIFFFIRYHKETSFYQSLNNWDKSYDLTTVEPAESPFEKIVENSITLQTDQYTKDISENRQSVDQEKDELMSWIHDVKTPLTAMQLMIDRMEHSSFKSQLMYEWLRIHLLLDQQLHQKRIPFMQNDLYVETVELEPILHHEIRDLKSWCLQKGIGFDISLDVPTVISDAKWLSFIIRQLLTNALKYSEGSDITIHSFSEDQLTKLEIRDDGRGIDQKDFPRIFEKGFTSTNNHADHASTGMGLYLTKKVADVMRIHIDVQSQPGEGTSFILTFPNKNEFLKLTGM